MPKGSKGAIYQPVPHQWAGQTKIGDLSLDSNRAATFKTMSLENPNWVPHSSMTTLTPRGQVRWTHLERTAEPLAELRADAFALVRGEFGLCSLAFVLAPSSDALCS